MRSLEQLGRSSEAKDRKKTRKVKCDRRTDGRTDRPTDKGVESLSTRLKTERATVGPLGLFFLLFPSLASSLESFYATLHSAYIGPSVGRLVSQLKFYCFYFLTFTPLLL